MRYYFRRRGGNPNRTHEDFTYLAIEAFREAWPCRPSKGDFESELGGRERPEGQGENALAFSFS